MIQTIQLNSLSEENLNKTVSEYLQLKDENPCKFINEHKNSILKIIHRQFIIIGKVLSCNDTFVRYNGYYITTNTISKHTSAVTTADNILVSTISNEKYEEYSHKIENILSEIEETRKFLVKEAKNNSQKIKGFSKPDKSGCLSLVVDSDFIRNFANTTLKELYDKALTKYNNLLENYKKSYHENKKLIGKYFITPYTIGYVSDFDNNSSRLICEQFWLEENKLVEVCHSTVITECNFHDDSFKLFSKMQDILFNIRELFSEILI